MARIQISEVIMKKKKKVVLIPALLVVVGLSAAFAWKSRRPSNLLVSGTLEARNINVGSKVGGRINQTFGENTPERMREMVVRAGYRIVEEDLTVLWNSGIIRFTL